MPSKKGTAVTPAEKAAIIVLRAKGVPVRRVAEMLGRSARTIESHITATRKLAKLVPESGYDWKQDMREQAINATFDGLACDEDPYKRGTLGVSVLKGLGDLQPDGNILQLNQLINSVPADMRHEFFIETEVVK